MDRDIGRGIQIQEKTVRFQSLIGLFILRLHHQYKLDELVLFLESEEQKEGHHQTEQTHGLGQSES